MRAANTLAASVTQPVAYERIDSVQALRFLASAMVVCFHAVLPMGRLYPNVNMPDLRWAAFGVDIFFVISGFIIAYVIERRPTDRVTFLWHRIARLVPLYWFFTILMATALYVLPHAFYNARFSLPHLVQSLLFIPAKHPVTSEIAPVLFPGWTLNYEMLFYALFALFLPLSLPKRTAVIGAIFIFLSTMNYVVTPGAVLGFYTFPITIEFVAGMILALLYSRGASISRAAIWTILVIGIFVFAAGIWKQSSAGAERILFWGVPAFAMVALALFRPAPGWMRSRLIRHLGDASYSLYLVHMFALSAATMIAAKLQLTWLPPLVMFATFLASSLLAGSLVHLFIEKPLLRWTRMIGRRGASRSKPKTELHAGSAIGRRL
jgi:exopolysaccharide production protein ExoZ